MPQPEIAILVSSFERPGHVRRVLASIAAQRDVGGAMEVVVTDDGSRDETPRLVRQFAASAGFPVRFTTHPHAGFHIARCRNEGVAASTAPYLLFLDGDCILPPDHVRIHLDRRRAGYALAGYPIYLNRQISEQITAEDVSSGQFQQHASLLQRLQMRWRHLRSRLYSLLNDPQRPKVLGGNLGIARKDYERVNGYDENFRGWGCEDDDLGLRLRASGVRVASIAWWTNTFHLWHPKTPTAPATWRSGANVEYYQRPLRLTRCCAGIERRRPQDIAIEIVGRAPRREALDRLLPAWCRTAVAAQRLRPERVEIEIAFATEGGTFSGRSDCRVLIVPERQAISRQLVSSADLIFSAREAVSDLPRHSFPLRSLGSVLQQQLGFRPAAPRRATSPAPALPAALAAVA